MFKKILYPLNFGYSKISLDLLTGLSKLHGAELIFLHTYRLAPINLSSDTLVVVKNKQEEGIRRRFQRSLDQSLRQSHIPYTLLVEIGFLADRMLGVCQHQGIELLVVNSRLKELMQGDFAGGYDELIRKIACPVMFIPQ